MDIAALLSTWGGHLVGILAALVGAFALFHGGKRIGSAETESRMTEQHAKEAVDAANRTVEETVQIAEEVSRVQSEVHRLDTGDAASRLREEWSRDR